MTPTSQLLLLPPLPDGGYPNASMPCAHAPFSTSGTGTWCDSYDWSNKRDSDATWSSSDTWSPLGYGYRNCTDWVGLRLLQLGVPTTTAWRLGNAGQWPANARTRNLKVTPFPKQWTAAVVAGEPGHVAFVEAVHANGEITVSEYNAVGDGTFRIWRGAPENRGFTEFVSFNITKPT